MKNKTDNKFKVQISSIISGIAVLISLSSLLYQVNINGKAIENQNTKDHKLSMYLCGIKQLHQLAEMTKI